MVDGHRTVFREAMQVYSLRAFLWRGWATGYWHRAQIEWRWRHCSRGQMDPTDPPEPPRLVTA